MKRASLLVAFSLPLLVTAASLFAVSSNRSESRAPILLTHREAALAPGDENNTFRTLFLSWHGAPDSPDTWFDRAKLASLGFATSVDPAAPGAAAHYGRLVPRDGFVAFELDGPAWRALRERADLQTGPRFRPREGADFREWASRLVAVDAARDGEALAARYPDGRTHIVTAAVFSIHRLTVDGASPFLAGSIDAISPNRIYVPREWAAALPAATGDSRPAYTVSIRYGKRFEPWVAGAGRR